MKNLTVFLLALVLYLSGVAFATVEGPIFEAQTIDEFYGDYNYFKYQNSLGREGIVSREGEKQCEDKYAYIQDVGYGYYEATIEYGLNKDGLIDVHGNVLIPMQYYVLQPFSTQWVAAVTVVPTESDDADFSIPSLLRDVVEKYNIEQVEFWYIPEGRAVGTLNREQYKRARAVGGGKYLLVSDRKDVLTLYNSNFEPVNHLFKRFFGPEYCIYDAGMNEGLVLCSCVTGESIDVEVPEEVEILSNAPEYLQLKKKVTINFEKEMRSALMTTDGTLVTDYVLGSTIQEIFDGRYVVSGIYNREKKKSLFGVYDLQEKKEILPYVYECIEDFQNGYFLVSQDNSYGFVDLENNISCPIEYIKKKVEKKCGCVLVTKDGKMVAADGTVTVLKEKDVADIYSSEEDANGMFLPVKNKKGQYGVIDWHGNMIIDFVLSSYPHIHRDGYAIINDAIYRLSA